MLVPVGAEAGAPATGERHTCVLVAGNDVRCWGDGTEGQLGDGLATTSYAPVVVASLPPVVQIGAGQAHACARTNNGQVLCWGRGAQGQLGDGNTAQQNAPVQALGIAAASHLAVGWNHACAIDGVTVLCWGQNGSGQLGTGDLSPHASPQAVTFDPVITPEALVAGEAHTCVLTSAQEIICWGANEDGQLGSDGPAGTQPAPGAPVVEGGWLDLAAGGAQTCARRSEDTSVWCWGDGDSGQLGDGGLADRRIPSRAYGLCVPL